MTLEIGQQVTLKIPQSYLKTSDPIPMLRPPDLVSLEETGKIIKLLPKDMAEVRFRRGTFLLSIDHLSSQPLLK
ncbi:NAD(P)H dehydrogenase assembly family protein [Prochlorococcus marinus]|uniref:NAD(P)H dehydrogenase assembly family protein n=1 Tax=Prochlorococcus marinus TaxID=1219 RepID=UPI0022B4DB0E|nr:NAD(P)H dehydrogenase assembly family protein [Prochlorococcus marinus]